MVIPASQAVDKGTFVMLPTEPIVMTTDGKNAAAVALGRLGGVKGGKARAASLSPKKRKAIAKKAAMTRWKKVADIKKASARIAPQKKSS